jgi:hypothetical protein
MSTKFQTYIGIDIQAAHKPFFYAALQDDLEIIATGHGRLLDVLAYLSGQSAALVAINGPICAQHPGGESLQGGLFDRDESDDKFVPLRTGEAELISRGFAYSVPGKILERGLDLVSRLRELDYTIFAGNNTARSFLETQCDAACWLSTGSRPYDSHSLEGRLQRQLLLCEFGLSLKDPMAFLEEFTRHRLRTSQVPMDLVLSAHELRALMAAAIAWLVDTRPEAIERLGITGEGEIFLPREFLHK